MRMRRVRMRRMVVWRVAVRIMAVRIMAVRIMAVRIMAVRIMAVRSVRICAKRERQEGEVMNQSCAREEEEEREGERECSLVVGGGLRCECGLCLCGLCECGLCLCGLWLCALQRPPPQPQSYVSHPRQHMLYSAPGPPSSQSPSLA